MEKVGRQIQLRTLSIRALGYMAREFALETRLPVDLQVNCVTDVAVGFCMFVEEVF